VDGGAIYFVTNDISKKQVIVGVPPGVHKFNLAKNIIVFIGTNVNKKYIIA